MNQTVQFDSSLHENIMSTIFACHNGRETFSYEVKTENKGTDTSWVVKFSHLMIDLKLKDDIFKKTLLITLFNNIIKMIQSVAFFS